MTSRGSKSRIKWEGDSLEEIKSWAKEARPGVSELRDQDEDFWYRVLYALRYGWIYVLHCFKKKTNKISQNDITVAKQRLAEVERRDKPSTGEEKKSA
jgi:phage-related protein